MEEKTMRLGDREYVIQNKAEEAMLNKWKNLENANFKLVNTKTGEVIKSFNFSEIRTGKIEHPDCYFYVEGDKDCPTFCRHPDNKHLDYPPCKNCKKYITNETVYNYIVDIVENVKTCFEITEDNCYGRQTRDL